MKISHSRFIRTIGALVLPLVLLALSSPLGIMAASPRSPLRSVNAADAPITASAFPRRHAQAVGGPRHLDAPFIVSASAGLPDTDATTQRLLAEPDRHRQRHQALLRRGSRRPTYRPAQGPHPGRRRPADRRQGGRYTRRPSRIRQVVRQRRRHRHLPEQRQPDQLAPRHPQGRYEDAP